MQALPVQTETVPSLIPAASTVVKEALAILHQILLCPYMSRYLQQKKGLPPKVTVQNLEVVKVDLDKNALLIKGSVPGNKGSILKIKLSVKASK